MLRFCTFHLHGIVRNKILFETKIEYVFKFRLPLGYILTKATITWCDLSARLFFIDATLLCEFESDKI